MHAGATITWKPLFIVLQVKMCVKDILFNLLYGLLLWWIYVFSGASTSSKPINGITKPRKYKVLFKILFILVNCSFKLETLTFFSFTLAIMRNKNSVQSKPNHIHLNSTEGNHMNNGIRIKAEQQLLWLYFKWMCYFFIITFLLR